jgi:alpha-glucuronidase
MRSGKTLWEELISHYDRGVSEVETMRASWAGLERFVDPERFAKTTQFLDIQLREARWWRDACIAYFMHQSGKELPAGVRPPEESLEYYQSLEFPFAPGN